MKGDAKSTASTALMQLGWSDERKPDIRDLKAAVREGVLKALVGKLVFTPIPNASLPRYRDKPREWWKEHGQGVASLSPCMNIVAWYTTNVGKYFGGEVKPGIVCAIPLEFAQVFCDPDYLDSCLLFWGNQKDADEIDADDDDDDDDGDESSGCYADWWEGEPDDRADTERVVV